MGNILDNRKSVINNYNCYYYNYNVIDFVKSLDSIKQNTENTNTVNVNTINTVNTNIVNTNTYLYHNVAEK
jgi:hypothetical protein